MGGGASLEHENPKCLTTKSSKSFGLKMFPLQSKQDAKCEAANISL